MAHSHKVYDSDVHFKIDAINRNMTNESDIKKIMLIQNDHNSERFTFELPRYIEEHDMTSCNAVEIHYLNTDSKTRETSTGLYIIEDLQVSPDDENVVVMSWLLSRNATRYVGNLSFLISFKCLNGEEIEYMWSTAIYSKITIASSIYNSETVAELYVDILEQWRNSLANIAYNATDLVRNEVNTYMIENPIETPQIKVEQFEGGAKISAKDSNGTTEAVIYDGGGERGNDGIGIEKIEQIKNEEDDGDNVITITLTDGTSKNFTVQNGSKGSQGEQGEKGDTGEQGNAGKSAYQYALDGGYNGTEEEFINLMINGLTTSDVVNNLTSTATNLPLSAYQGKVLNDKIENSGSSNWTLVLNNEENKLVDLSKYTEIRVYVYGKAENSVCKYSMSHDFLIDELLSQDSYFATIPGNIGYGDDFDNAFIDFYPTTSKRSFGVGYVDARYGGEYYSDATFKIYAR